jgi:hypothetical protein
VASDTGERAGGDDIAGFPPFTGNFGQAPDEMQERRNRAVQGKGGDRIGSADLPARGERLDDLEAVLIVPATPRPVESRRDGAPI